MRGGRGRGNFRGGNFGGGRGFRGRGRGQRDFMATPSAVSVLGEFTHMCEDFAVCKATTSNVPLINRPVFTEEKKKLGVVDEVFGPINSYGFTIKLDEGVTADEFEEGSKVYIDPMQIKPVGFFQHRPKPPKEGKELDRQGMVPKRIKGPNAIAKRGGFRGRFGGGFRGPAARGSFGFRGAPRGMRGNRGGY
eukprot:TRINITY_DN887_c0_g1_i1.p1 TRINITY_DN887_c0_g1~~TRINITY_DN887_c0_g1_i1.p1  ORF type:complete len:192 (+),score=43.65 TRINITY_DN887_c0_g1_i1:119-694(+)